MKTKFTRKNLLHEAFRSIRASIELAKKYPADILICYERANAKALMLCSMNLITYENMDLLLRIIDNMIFE